MINRYWVAAALALAVALVVRIKMGAKEKGDAVLKGVPRLPTEVIPRSYDVELKPNLETCHFEGKLVVKVDIIEPTSEIILNAADLKIAEKSAWVRLDDSREVLWPSVHLDAENELLILKLEQSLKAGSASLSLEFEGVLNDQMKGFYRSSYQVGEEKRNMAVTQFEPADARRCFPCWDEPARKAKFKITVHAPVDRVVLSNMPVQMENVSNGIKTIQFEETPIMSTYLVAIVVGELGYVEGTTVDGSKVRVYCDPGKVDQGKFALDVALRTLPYYAEYFGTAYPLPKLDMVAIPDFAAGAMENYGLVTYREAALLFDEKNSAAANRQRIAIVVAHELAHQWFGNLVTMEWWTHLWLNEGFATWVSYLAIDHLFPEWNVWTQFNELTAEAFRLDGLVESHPIEVDIGHVREIDEIFDAISYKKGASIIRMLENYLTPKVFQKGLASYIKKYAYKNAKTENLWDVLSHESGQPIRELMDSWTKQQGYPVVYVQFKENALDIVQSQYLSNGSPGTGEWVVPVTFCCGNYASPASTLVQEKFGSFVVSSNLIDENVEQWVKINVGQTGFYRVHYDEHLFSKLKSAIAAGSLQAADRLGILDDTYALCKACKLPVKDLLSLMEVYKQETEYAVLSCLISVAHAVAKVICDAFPDLGDAADAFVSSIFQDAAKRVGWELQQSESHLISMLRGELISALVTFGDHETVNESRRRFNLYLNDRDTPYLPPDIRKAAYEAVMQGVTKQDRSGYEALLQLYRETDLSQERTRILSALAASRDPRVVREALEFSLSSEVRNQDAIYILSGVGKEGRETTWSWFKENWDQIWNRWGEGFLITRFISGSASGFYTDEKADEIASFFSTRSNKAIERTVSQTVERVRINSQWVKHVRDEHGLLEMLKS